MRKREKREEVILPLIDNKGGNSYILPRLRKMTGSSAGASAPGSGPGGRRFESSLPDNVSKRKLSYLSDRHGEFFLLVPLLAKWDASGIPHTNHVIATVGYASCWVVLELLFLTPNVK